MIKITTQLLLLLMPLSIFCQSTLGTIGESTKVSNKITLDYKGEDFDYYIDDAKDPMTLSKVDYFQISSEEFRVYVKFLNPLKYRYSTSSKEVEDEIFKASQEFLDAAVSYLSEFQNTSQLGRKGTTTITSEANAYALEPELLEIYLFLQSFNNQFFNKYPLIKTEMQKLNLYELGEKFKKDYATSFENLYSINSLSQIESTLSTNKAKFSDHETALGEVQSRLTILKNSFNNVTYSTDFPISDHGFIEVYVETKLNELEKDLQQIRNTRADLKLKYNTLEELFKKFTPAPNDDNSFELYKNIDLNEKKRHELTINLEKLKYDEKNYSLSVEDKKTWVIHIRPYRFFIPVVSSGVLYSPDLIFTTYGTDEDAEGNTIVSKSGEEEDEIAIGAFLNLYLNPIHKFPVFAQFGVGPSKEKPLFFLGGGAVIFQRLSLSTGMIFTWFPELDTLSVGDIVTGTSAIEEDISYSFDTTPRFYLSINLNISSKNEN